jgi:hypothetical protein
MIKCIGAQDNAVIVMKGRDRKDALKTLYMERVHRRNGTVTENVDVVMTLLGFGLEFLDYRDGIVTVHITYECAYLHIPCTSVIISDINSIRG